jgi:hypothetical protein
VGGTGAATNEVAFGVLNMNNAKPGPPSATPLDLLPLAPFLMAAFWVLLGGAAVIKLSQSLPLGVVAAKAGCGVRIEYRPPGCPCVHRAWAAERSYFGVIPTLLHPCGQQ